MHRSIFAEERGNAYWYNDSTNEAEFKEEWPARVRKSDAQWAGFEAVTLEANKNYLFQAQNHWMTWNSSRLILKQMAEKRYVKNCRIGIRASIICKF